jgi:KaiC/GvpD/RAD55 family RecA-like ATPase
MTEQPASRAKRASRTVPRLPFGFPTLDGRFRGVPAGSAVLLGGAPDAGTDAFAYTRAAALMTTKHFPGLGRGSLDAAAREALPERVHYVTLDRDRRHVLHQMDSVLDARRFNTLVEHLTVTDLSEAYLDAAPVPEQFRTTDAADREGVADFSAFLDRLADEIAGSESTDLVVLDSVTALRRATEYGLDWGEVIGFLAGLRNVAAESNGLVDVLYHARPDDVRSDERINTVLDGGVYFYANDEGDRAEKTMRVGEFGGALSRRRQVVYETSVTDSGFKVKSSRRI